MDFEEKEELLSLLEERTMSDFERRRRRFLAAQARLWGLGPDGKPLLTGLPDLLDRARHRKPLIEDEVILLSGGFLPEDLTPERQAERERRYRKAGEEARSKVLNEWRELRKTNPLAGGEGVTRMLAQAGLGMDVKESPTCCDPSDEVEPNSLVSRRGPL